jgi:hypothetical protein
MTTDVGHASTHGSDPDTPARQDRFDLFPGRVERTRLQTRDLLQQARRHAGDL